MRFPEQYRLTPELHRKRPDLSIPDQYITTLASSPYGGLFLLPRKQGVTGTFFRAIASCTPEIGWEHVSVSLLDLGQRRCPTWDEMNFIKGLFWSDDDTVVQYHPPKADYVNLHPYCLHLWRPMGQELPRPPKILL